MNNKRIRIVILVAAITGMMAVGSIMAYFTDGESVSNTFTVGKISLSFRNRTGIRTRQKILHP
ncbi:MAG: SipW-dependent-type signal peptide-containing protein [Lachnoclostridium sp.]